MLDQGKMDCQDWITVTVKRPHNKKESIHKSTSTIQAKDPQQAERIRMAKLESAELPPPKKRIHPESLQSLIRKRIEMKITQDKADALCSFPKHTFRDIESNRLIPNEEQKRRIQQNFAIQIKVDTL